MKSEDQQERIEDLFSKVIALSQSTRSVFLDQACADDPAEIRLEVERLLALDDAAERHRHSSPSHRFSRWLLR